MNGKTDRQVQEKRQKLSINSSEAVEKLILKCVRW